MKTTGFTKWPALTLPLSPGRGNSWRHGPKSSALLLLIPRLSHSMQDAADRQARSLRLRAANVSPSPGGEGWGEGVLSKQFARDPSVATSPWACAPHRRCVSAQPWPVSTTRRVVPAGSWCANPSLTSCRLAITRCQSSLGPCQPGRRGVQPSLGSRKMTLGRVQFDPWVV